MMTQKRSRSFIALLTIGIALTVCATCYAIPGDTEPEQYVHHEYIDGTARIDYVEVVNGDHMVTHYYKYAHPANKFLATSVEVYDGSRYTSPRLLRIVRYEYDSKNSVVNKTVQYGPAGNPAAASQASALEAGSKGAAVLEGPNNSLSPAALDLAARR